jgi:hypothetical protein
MGRFPRTLAWVFFGELALGALGFFVEQADAREGSSTLGPSLAFMLEAALGGLLGVALWFSRRSPRRWPVLTVAALGTLALGAAAVGNLDRSWGLAFGAQALTALVLAAGLSSPA